MGWRDHASTTSQADLDLLFGDCIDLAGKQLEDLRTFTPFMLVLGNDGKKSARSGGCSNGADSKSQIRDALHAPDDRLRIRACAVALDVAIDDGRDAIEVQLEHIEGVALDVVVPYLLTDGDVDVQIQSASASTGSHRLWRGRLDL